MDNEEIYKLVTLMLNNYNLSEDQRQDVYLFAFQNANEKRLPFMLSEYIDNIQENDEEEYISTRDIDFIVSDLMDSILAHQVIEASIMKNMYSILTKIEQAVLTLRFGLDGNECRNISQISHILHIQPIDVTKTYESVITKCRKQKNCLLEDVTEDSLLYDICMIFR